MTAKLIKISKKKIIKNYKGNIIKFINNKNNLFKKFDEVYFSEIKPNMIKGWNYHKKNTCLISVIIGKVKFFIFDPSKKKLLKIILSEKNNKIIQIPSKLWFSFKSFSSKSILINIIDNVHSSKESLKSKNINGIIIK